MMMFIRIQTLCIVLALAGIFIATPTSAQFVTPLNDTGQTYWNLQYPPVDFSAAEKMYAVTDSVLYILSAGFLLRSSDGGVTWKTLPLPGGFTVYGASFWGDSLCWLAGDEAVIYKSTDGGVTWVLHIASGLDAINLNTVQFLSPTKGWASGTYGFVFYTNDGGESWTPVNYMGFYLGGANSYVRAISDSVIWVVRAWLDPYVPGNTGWVYVFRTTAGDTSWYGTGWEMVKDGPAFYDWPMNISIEETNRDPDAYLNFSLVNICSAENAEFQFLPSSAYDTPGYDFITSNSGATWDSSIVPDSAIKDYIRTFTCAQGWYANIQPYAYPRTGLNDNIDEDTLTNLYRSSGGGSVKWLKRNTPATPHVFPCMYDFIDTTTGWCFTRNDNDSISFYETTDGAKTWQLKSSWPVNSGSLKSVFFLNSKTGWCTGQNTINGTVSGGIVMHTSDQGNHWAVLNAAIPDTGLKQIQFMDTLTGWALGDSLYKTTDGGYHWQIDANFPTDTLRPNVNYVRVQFVDPLDGWLVRSDWMTYRTTDGGISWNVAHGADTTVNLTIAIAISPDSLIAFGTLSDSAYEFRILEGGASFQEFAIVADTTGNGDFPTKPSSVVFYNSQHGWLFDTNGSEYFTSDGGLTWSFILSGSGWYPVLCTDFPDSTNGWMLKGNTWDMNGNLVSPAEIIRLTQNGLSTAVEPAILHQLYSVTFVGDTMGWAVGDNLSIYHYYLPFGVREKFLPRIVVSPPVLSFDSVNVGTPKTMAVNISNPGGDTLFITNATIPATYGQTFRVATLIPQEDSGIAIPPGQRDSFYVSFTPPVQNTYYDTLFLYSNADTSFILLYGVGRSPEFIVEPYTIATTQLSNYPNPFTTSTNIIFTSVEEDVNRVSVVDMLGREIAVLQDGLTGNTQNIVWSPDETVPAGMYFLIARGKSGEVSKPVMLLR